LLFSKTCFIHPVLFYGLGMWEYYTIPTFPTQKSPSHVHCHTKFSGHKCNGMGDKNICVFLPHPVWMRSTVNPTEISPHHLPSTPNLVALSQRVWVFRGGPIKNLASPPLKLGHLVNHIKQLSLLWVSVPDLIAMRQTVLCNFKRAGEKFFPGYQSIYCYHPSCDCEW